eukprot:gene9159-16286_t
MATRFKIGSGAITRSASSLPTRGNSAIQSRTRILAPSLRSAVTPSRVALSTTNSLPATRACSPRADNAVARGASVRCAAAEARVAAPAGGKMYSSVLPGQAEPLGPSKQGNAVNFAIYARDAHTVTICLFDADNKFVEEMKLDSSKNKTGDIWHVAFEAMSGSAVCYGFKMAGDGGWETGNRWMPNRVLLDPYAPLVSSRRVFGKRDEYEHFAGKDGSFPDFDWGHEEEARKRNHLKDLVVYEIPDLVVYEMPDLVVYEMPVRSFTADASSGLPEGQRGTFVGVGEKAEYIAGLGINAVELLPVFEYDELEFQRQKNPRDHMTNIWGYSHINFFSPMSRFAADGAGPAAAARDFKQMVKKLHAAGVDVLLDVVYNHTNESDDRDPYTVSFRGIESKTYYMTDIGASTQLINYSGCGNTINANNPVVMKLIIDSLVHWVTEYHVDGFRFDLASALCRDEKGHPLGAPPLIKAIAMHPLLGKTHLIAEPWDIGMYQVGSFPNWDIWAEWNGKYRDDIRKFIKGDAGMKGALATRLAGSSDLYQSNQRKPAPAVSSSDFCTVSALRCYQLSCIAHDGFSLYDMVTYNGKHNDANGENNNDGTNDNFSWNCGHEGPTGDGVINALRNRQMRNMVLALMISQGTPMIVMGDECCKTHGGNNNWYGHDNKMAHLNWDLTEEASAMKRFTSELIKFRKEHPALGRETFVG